MGAILASADTAAVTVVVVHDQKQLREATPAWLELLDRGTVGHNVHNDPRMILFTLIAQPKLQPKILMVYQGGQLVCVAPFYNQAARFSFEFSVWRLLSFKARVMRVFGESVVLAADANPELCVAAVGDFLRKESSSIDFLQVYGLNYEDRFWQAALRDGAFAARADLACIAMRTNKSHKIVLKNTFEEYMATLSPATRQNLRSRRRRLFRDNNVRVEKINQASDIARLLLFVSQVDRDSWQEKTFGKSNEFAFVTQQFIEQIAAEGWLRSYVLLRNNEPIAYQRGYQYRRIFYAQGTAYCRRFSAEGPGSVLKLCVLEDLHSDNAADIWDLGFGDLPHKRSMSNLEHDTAIVYFVPHSRWRYILKLQTVINATDDWIRAALIRLHIDRFARKLIKRQK